jgi:hypothetical protein
MGSVAREPPFREDLSAEAETVSRERLLKTQEAGRDLECAAVIFSLWRLAMAL